MPGPIISSLAEKQCQPVKPGTPPLEGNEISELIGSIRGWDVEGGSITKRFDFKNHYETQAFVNAVAWISHRQDHHPDMEVGYNQVKVTYSTHSVNGLSENDFICAARIEKLFV
jgi:4a-hydroxytetrahydrobiopterin dehydratase